MQVSCLNGKVFKCRHVILAVPLPLQTRLTFDPPLPSLRNQLIQRAPMGSVIKTFMYYDRPFWQEKGHSGTAIIEDEEALVEFTFADSKPDGTKPAIMGLILAGRAKTCVTLTKEERRDRICKLYARVFETDKALKWVHYEELNWLAEQWSGGCYSAMMPPGFLTTFGRDLRKPNDRIHFAGTETATEWVRIHGRERYKQESAQQGRFSLTEERLTNQKY
uniref:Amine oxidase n=1 Tax=Pinctada fucata TaxID=50426 RepID=A0A194AQK3_PINFU